MSWTLFVRIMMMMTWGGILARYVVEGVGRPATRKEPKA